MEEYQDTANLDPESIQFIIPTKSETTEPGIKNNLLNLRIKSYKIAKGISYSIPGDYTPNIPKNFQYAINSGESQKYKEVDFCNKIANDICKP
jgi:hypothetical protein